MLLLNIIILVLLKKILPASGDTATWRIGGLFNIETSSSSLKVYDNIRRISHTYHGSPIYVNVTNIYTTSLKVCTKSEGGITALIDARPTNGICDNTCLICNRLQVPHLSVGWEPPQTLSQDLFTFSYYPTPDMISKAFANLIKEEQWDKFTILYEDDKSFIRLQEVIHTWPYENDPIVYRKLNPNGDNREIFKEILKVAHMSYHLLDCKKDHVIKYMQQMMQVDNSTQYQSFILTSLDAYTVNFTQIPNLMANVSTFHISKDNDVRWKDYGMSEGSMGLETALVADALTHLEKAIRKMQNEAIETGTKVSNPPPLCYDAVKEKSTWPSGYALRQALIETTADGFTGNIQFNEKGQRTNFELYYSKMNNESEFVYAGTWHSETDIIDMDKSLENNIAGLKSNTTLRVVSRKGEPYFMVNETTQTFEGYAVDLIDEIFSHIKNQQNKDLNYEFYRVAGDKHGGRIEGTKKWDGIIGELVEHNADLAICDITITSERNAVVDFSAPFMSLGISILFAEPDPVAPDMFSFINPLSLDVWLYLVTCYIIVSFILLICARMSQGDWVNPHPCNTNPDNFQNIWSLYNCMWLTMGSIMTQGCDILPRAGGSRWVTGMWWFFALIVTSSYTANLSNFLSNDRRDNDIKNVRELSEQNKVSYGAVLNSSTYRFFESSNDTVYQKIWTVMKSTKPTVFTKDNEEGKNKVLQSKGKYAFFMESTAIEYYTNKNSDLKMIGSQLDSKEYGIAMPKNSKHRSYIDKAILALQENGRLKAIKDFWWDAGSKKKEDEEDSGSLQMKNISGIFLVLGVGSILGFFVAVIDFVLHAHKICVLEKVTFREALISEWRACLNPRTTRKPAAPPRSAAPSMESSPRRERSHSRAVSVLKAATSFINFDEIY